MSGELEVLLRLVAEGRLTAEEAAPIVAALEEKERAADGSAAGGSAAGGSMAGGAPNQSGRRRMSGQDLLSDRKLRVYVAERGRQVINMSIPLAAAGYAIDQVPGLSPDHRSRIAEAIQKGLTGPLLEVSDEGDEVRIAIE